MNKHFPAWDWESRYLAPAKLNLFLHVVGRRDDGYHELQTVFTFIDYADTLSFKPRQDGKIHLENPLPGVPVETDLTVRAARLLQQESGTSKGVEISLEKHLPMGGGLGGGSSDAATVLIALNHLWQLGFSREQLQQIGLKLGADVPVFIFGQNTFAEGVGEKFRPVHVPPCWYVMLFPPVEIPTATIFSSPALKRDTRKIPVEDWKVGMGTNDLEPVASSLFPVVSQYLQWLKQFGDARMSGSGASVFAGFSTEEEAIKVFEQRAPYMRGLVAKGLGQHPLFMP